VRDAGGFRCWLRLWFSLDEPVDRRRYLGSGLGLMVFKYAVDASAVFLLTGQFWSPIDYIVPSLIMRSGKLQAFPAPLLIGMMLWTLPFLWIGVSMTLRRAVDAGRSPWLCFLFFVPLLNYALMVVLSLMPSRPRPAPARVALPIEPPWRAKALAVSAGVVLGIALVPLGTLLPGGYGGTLFLGIPFFVGALSAFILNRRHLRTIPATELVAMTTISFVGVGLLLFAVEGVVCLAMALPPALLLAMLGAYLGRCLAVLAPGTSLHAMVVALLLPGAVVVESGSPAPPLREVVSTIEIEAPPEMVWRHVVSFSELDDPPRWFFRLGIAYPKSAHIEGRGVGAIRRCEFSTGPFVEPITAWDEPHRLTFDVVAQPSPMTEWSPYHTLHPPHLDRSFRSRRGEFRLIPLPGERTRLEGRTWYELDMGPLPYWQLWADWIVHAIHDRVLTHVKRLSEDARGAAVLPATTVPGGPARAGN
jgi:uncharacterized membrane protein YhaH (DUF805 family)